MSNQLLQLLKQCNKKTHKVKRLPRNKRGSTTDFEKRIATSPYAAILASPLRQCKFHRRIFPSKFLLRFGIGWHQATNAAWVYPTLGKRHEYNGQGHYISLGENILNWIQSGAYKSIFRNESVAYRSDMSDHVRKQLTEHAYISFCKYPFERLVPLTQPVSESRNNEDYQCILLLSSPSSTSSPSIQIEDNDDGDKHIPCYDISALWPQYKHDIETKLNSPETIGLGVPRDKASVDLAITLWRCHFHLKQKSALQK